jgi:hypothetical protein
VEADRELAAGEQGRVRVGGEGQVDRVAPGPLAGRDGHAVRPAEAHRAVGAGDHRGAAELEADEAAVERQRLVPKALEKRRRAWRPTGLGPQHQAQGLVVGAGRRHGKAKRWSGCAEGLPTG